MSAAGDPESDSKPLLRVVRGNPTPEELAALVAVIAASSATAEPPPVGRGEWSSRRRLHGAPLRPGRCAWRASALPS